MIDSSNPFSAMPSPFVSREALVVFNLDDGRYGLPLSAVERVVRMVEITPLPKAPDIVLGIVSSQGRVIAVIDVRRRFRLPERRIALSDQMLIAETTKRQVALIIDSVLGVIEYSASDAVPQHELASHLSWVRGIVQLDDGLILIHDLEAFLSDDEETALARALETIS